MDVVLTDEVRYARKTYPCDASIHWLESGMTAADCETSEQLLLLQAAMADRWKIRPGQAYRYVRGVYEGHMETWRARPGMQALCAAHGLFD